MKINSISGYGFRNPYLGSNFQSRPIQTVSFGEIEVLAGGDDFVSTELHAAGSAKKAEDQLERDYSNAADRVGKLIDHANERINYADCLFAISDRHERKPFMVEDGSTIESVDLTTLRKYDKEGNLLLEARRWINYAGVYSVEIFEQTEKGNKLKEKISNDQDMVQIVTNIQDDPEVNEETETFRVGEQAAYYKGPSKYAYSPEVYLFGKDYQPYKMESYYLFNKNFAPEILIKNYVDEAFGDLNCSCDSLVVFNSNMKAKTIYEDVSCGKVIGSKYKLKVNGRYKEAEIKPLKPNSKVFDGKYASLPVFSADVIGKA